MSDIDTLLSRIQSCAATQKRVLVAVAGPPASGKSTLAETLAERLGPEAAVLPMDGFHLDNAELIEMGLLERKGAPETFDATGFVRLVRELQETDELSYPTFDRDADKTVPEGGHIGTQTRIVIVEGNYLLLNFAPWSDLAECFDITVQLEVERDLLEARLIQRWLDQGMPEEAARARAIGNDMRNVDFVSANSVRPDVTLRQ